MTVSRVTRENREALKDEADGLRLSDVFVSVRCSECNTSLGTYHGVHAVIFQSSVFRAIRNHNPDCKKILAKMPELSQKRPVGRPRKVTS